MEMSALDSVANRQTLASLSLALLHVCDCGRRRVSGADGVHCVSSSGLEACMQNNVSILLVGGIIDRLLKESLY